MQRNMRTFSGALLSGVFLLSMVAPALSAGAKPRWRPAIAVWTSYTAMDAIMYASQVDSGDWMAADITRGKALARLDEEVQQHLDAAKAEPVIEADVKDYYLAATTYFHDAWPDRSIPQVVARANVLRLRQELNRQERKLRLDLDI